MGADCYHARTYEKSDWPLVKGWWDAHGSERVLVEAMLPPLGIIVEREGLPVVALWAHMSVNVGVAFLENPVSRPGMTLLETARAMESALDCMDVVLKTHGYGVVIANTLPQIARWLERRRGFARAGDRVQMFKVIN